MNDSTELKKKTKMQLFRIPLIDITKTRTLLTIR